ncbi:MAG: hypothetical protein P0S95_06875 [Rhabdochlamydiaceae bacterium]|nr:hypothetical protein [Candidatus Amphrikana amoebophyrae]
MAISVTSSTACNKFETSELIALAKQDPKVNRLLEVVKYRMGLSKNKSK